MSIQDLQLPNALAGLAGPEFHEMSAASEDQRRLAATYEQAGIGIVEIDAAGKLLRVNSHACLLLGAKPEALLGKSLFDLTHPDDIERDRTQYARQVAGEIDGYSLEKRFRRPDGSYAWASITSSSVKDRQGRFLYAVRVQQDISDRKKAEEAVWRHTQERSALHQLTTRLQLATELNDVYAAAMDAIFWALQCQRASVLLFDAGFVMRFVASRELSEAYRKAVEGHSPWSADATDPQPICINDVAASDLSDELKAVVSGEGIAALSFVPLLDRGRLIGKFMIYYDAPHVFTADETALAVTIARHVSVGIERIRAQHAAQHLAAIVESSEDAIVSKDLGGIVRTWNAGAEKLFGYTADEAVGRPITELVIPQDRMSEEPDILQRIRRGERVEHFETVRHRKDGSLLDISLTISPIRDPGGRIIGASKIARDITEKKLAEKKLRDSERQLQDLLSAIPAAIYTTDAHGRVTYYNDAAVELAGRAPEQGSDEWCVTLYTPDGAPLPLAQSPMATALREGRPIRGVEAVVERPDGTRVPFIPYPTPLRDSDGNIVGAINMLVDISQRKEAETQQRVLLNELNHRVKNNMQMLQSLISNSIRQTKSEEARRTLEDASGRIAAMAAAQRALYSTTGAASRFDAQEFIRAVCSTAEQTFRKSAQISYRAERIELANDVAVPLALILNELLTNAVKYGASGNGATIRVALTRRADRCCLCVEDDGQGFDLDQARTRWSGLFLIQGLARQLGGQLTVSRSPTRCCVEFMQGLSS